MLHNRGVNRICRFRQNALDDVDVELGNEEFGLQNADERARTAAGDEEFVRGLPSITSPMW